MNEIGKLKDNEEVIWFSNKSSCDSLIKIIINYKLSKQFLHNNSNIKNK